MGEHKSNQNFQRSVSEIQKCIRGATLKFKLILRIFKENNLTKEQKLNLRP